MDTVIAEILVPGNSGRGRRDRVSTAKDTHLDEYSKLHRGGAPSRIAPPTIRPSSTPTTISRRSSTKEGWGSSFDFSYQFPHESFDEFIRRHLYQLAGHVGVYGKQFQVLDVGCGIEGPMRSIVSFLQCKITGIALHQYQVGRANELNEKDKFADCRSVQGNLIELPFEAVSCDGA